MSRCETGNCRSSQVEALSIRPSMGDVTGSPSWTRLAIRVAQELIITRQRRNGNTNNVDLDFGSSCGGAFLPHMYIILCGQLTLDAGSARHLAQPSLML